jgi:hypothetical protein
MMASNEKRKVPSKDLVGGPREPGRLSFCLLWTREVPSSVAIRASIKLTRTCNFTYSFILPIKQSLPHFGDFYHFYDIRTARDESFCFRKVPKDSKDADPPFLVFSHRPLSQLPLTHPLTGRLTLSRSAGKANRRARFLK